MFFLPEQSNMLPHGLEKLYTYCRLFNIGCPVLKSAIILPEENISDIMINQLKKYLKSEDATIRFQYIRPTTNPIQGGNRYKLERDTLTMLQNKETILWILQPVNRLKNDYGINMRFHDDYCNVEIVGKGFDVSDLNRGHISPHQDIEMELPIRMGCYNEWWKFFKYSFCSQDDFELSKNKRIQKLKSMGYIITDSIFDKYYRNLAYDKVEEMIGYISSIYNSIKEKDYCVSSTIINNGFIFWDIQTPEGKMKIYGA